jgi:lysophospholipase L1-like esterase
MKNSAKKGLIFLAGLLAILVLLEIALRILGFFSQGVNIEDYSKIDPKKSNYTILCLGDSHTLGYGVQARDSYPAQLERLLNSKSDKRFSVINKGLLAQNTSQLLAVIDGQLDKYKPDLIILLTGGSNHWNYYGYTRSSENWLYNIRLYKLAILLLKGVEDKRSSEEQENIVSKDLRRYKEKVRHYKELVNSEPGNVKHYFYVGLYLFKMQNMREAVEWFKKGIRIDPLYANNYLMTNLCYAFLNDWEATIEWLESEIEINPDNAILYDLMASNYERLNKPKESQRYYYLARSKSKANLKMQFEKIETMELNELEKRAAAADDGFRKMMEDNVRFRSDFYGYSGGEGEEKVINENMELVLDWIKSDLRKIIQKCLDRDIKIIMQKYALKPEKSSWTLTAQFVNYALDDIAKEYSVPLVDNEKNFKELGIMQDEYFTADLNDAHPNEKGYALFAEKLYEKMTELGLFSLKK